MEWREQEGVRWLEAELPGARAAFSTRQGGLSDPPFESLNLGILTGDDRETVAGNRERLGGRLGRNPREIVMSLQVHGAELVEHDGPQRPSPYAEPGSPLPEADGHVLSDPRLAAIVLVADCLPVALTGERGAAMLHCGWRGLAGGIVERGARAVDASAAAIGPGIGPCCYEVGDEVSARFEDLGEGVVRGRMLDLTEAARRLLRQAGVEAVEASEMCTSCEAELFYSHRRDGERTGRQGGLVWIEGGG